MYSIIGQVSYPVFLAGVFVFFILASIFSFIVGIGLLTRSRRMLRFFEFMNQRVSTRQLIKPLTAPRYIEPVALKHSATLGKAIIIGAILSVAFLCCLDSVVFQPVYTPFFEVGTADILADYTRYFLLFGNVLCIPVGILLAYHPEKLVALGQYTDQWLTLRRSTRPLYMPYFDMDRWVLNNSVIAGAALSVLSLLLGIWMYVQL